MKNQGKTKQYDKILQIRIDKKLREQAHAIAAQRGDTLSDVIRRALIAYAAGDLKLVA